MPIIAIDLDGLEPDFIIEQGGYDVQEGDTFWSLNEEWDLPQGTLENYNPDLDPANLQIGQTIKVTDPNQLASDFYSDSFDESGLTILFDGQGNQVRTSSPQRLQNEEDNMALMFFATSALDIAAGGAFPMTRAGSVSPSRSNLNTPIVASRRSPANTSVNEISFSELPNGGTINPSQVRYSQNSISPNFRDGSPVDGLIGELRSGTKTATDVQAIRIVEKDGLIYSLDNRRLYAFRQAGVDVRYQKLNAIPKRDVRKFTTQNEGTSITIRN